MAMKTEMKVLLYIKRSGQDKDGRSPPHGQDSRQGKEQLHRAVLLQVQGGREAVERHFPTMYGQEPDGGHGKPRD